MIKQRKRLLSPHLRWLLGDRIHLVVALTITALLTGICEASILAILATTASALVEGKSSIELDLGPLILHTEIGSILAIAFALSVARVGLGVAQSYFPPRVTGEVQAQLRRKLLSSFLGAAWSVQSQDREGHLQEIVTNQVNQASQAPAAATGLVGSVLTFIILVLTAFLLSPIAVLIVLLMSSVLFAILHPLRARGRTEAQALSESQMEFASAVGETNRMAEEARVFGATKAQEKTVGRYIDNGRDLFIRSQTILRLAPKIYQSVLYLFMVIGLLLIWLAGTSNISSLGAVVLLLIRAGTYGQEIQGGYQVVHQTMPFVGRVLDKANLYALSAPPPGTAPLPEVSSLSFEDVSFGYRRDVSVLSGFNFEVSAGETIGIVGPSGAGKSSTVQILLRLREPTDGRYLVNGLPAAEYFTEDWHARVAYVPQEPHLIHASVADNIRFYRDIDEAQVRRAALLAHVHSEIEGWPNGYQTIVGPRADAVSGGQQQRICLARALAASPDILILDEPTSALDPQSEQLVKQSLAGLKQDLTLFVIAHGPALLDICDRLMVIVNGRLEAFGPTASLLRERSYEQLFTGIPAEISSGQELS
jgi:ABC-type multidrug transport system fused ATPase/permease subunit